MARGIVAADNQTVAAWVIASFHFYWSFASTSLRQMATRAVIVLLASVSASNGVSGGSQVFGQFRFHFNSGFKRHWVQMFVKFPHQLHAVLPHHPS